MSKKIVFVFLIIALGLSACGTLEVDIEASIPTPTPPGPVVVTATASPELLLPTQTAAQTSSPSPIPASAACDRASLVSDVTVPDGTVFTPNTFFTKTWRLKNTGTCTWTTAYRLIFMSNHQMGGPASINLPAAVPPNTTIDLSIGLSAPAAQGSYRGYWALANASDTMFGVGSAGDKPFWVEIVVSNGTKTYRDDNLVFDYPSTWYVQSIPFGVQLTSYDPANPPHKLEWTPSTIAMSIQEPPRDFPPASPLDAFVESVKIEAAAANLDIVREEWLTLGGNPAARITLVSGSGGVFDRVGILVNGGLLEVNIEAANFDLARPVLDTLRRP